MPGTIQAALARDGPTIPWDRYREELAWQSVVAGDNATNGKAKQFFEELAGVGGGCKVFSWMKEGSPYVQVMHSIGKYFNTRGRQDLRTQTLGFIGNRDRFGNAPPTVTMLADNAWKWATVRGCFDPLVFEAFYANLDEKEKYWPGSNNPYTHVDKVLPRLF